MRRSNSLTVLPCLDAADELVLILKEAEQSDMLRRIGTCRKKVMGLLRLMGNKADVVKGLAKRCNESWSVAPKSDIVRPPLSLTYALVLADKAYRNSPTGPLLVRHPGPSHHDDAEPESLREDSLALALELPRPDLHRHDRRQQPDERGPLADDRARYRSHVRLGSLVLVNHARR